MSDLGASAKLDMGRVIQQLFAVLGRNFATFLVLSLILSGVPAVLVGLLRVNTLQSGQTFSWQSLVGSLAAAVASLILQSTMIYGTVTDLNGRRANLSDSLRVSLQTALPVLCIGILWYLAVVGASFLLLVPGMMIMAAWAVCVPAYVAERPPLTKAFGRSAELTRGNRWRIFGLIVIFLVGLSILELLVGVFGAASRIASGQTAPFALTVIFLPLISVVSAMVGAAGTAVLYVELRRIKDGVGAESLASIFD